VNWTNIWSFDDMDMGVPPNPFTDWKWYESNYLDQEPIDLSAYIGESDVRIAFQYYSNTTSSADQQEFSIDEINVIASGPGTNFTCDAGGPYSWWWMMQYEYFPNGVRFHGNVTNGTIFTQYLWDFGDGNTSISIPLNSDPVHFYNEIGTYIVTHCERHQLHTTSYQYFPYHRHPLPAQTTRDQYHSTNVLHWHQSHDQ
jgi:PKD repeat protein